MTCPPYRSKKAIAIPISKISGGREYIIVKERQSVASTVDRFSVLQSPTFEGRECMTPVRQGIFQHPFFVNRQAIIRGDFSEQG